MQRRAGGAHGGWASGVSIAVVLRQGIRPDATSSRNFDHTVAHLVGRIELQFKETQGEADELPCAVTV